MSVRSYNGVPVTPPSETPQDAAGGDCDAQELLTLGSLMLLYRQRPIGPYHTSPASTNTQLLASLLLFHAMEVTDSPGAEMYRD